jgi:hypothetical protein
MDLRAFYQKIRICEQEIREPHVVVVSLETGDGGKPGVKTEVSRAAAAKMIVEGKARIADKDEAAEYHKEVAAAIARREQESQVERMKVNIISDEGLAALRGALRPEKR